MKQDSAKNILNVAIAGHSGSGKTSLAEAMIWLCGGSDRLGKVSDGNTVCDFDAEEIKRKTSVQACIAPVEWKSKKINLIDAPGLFDFEGGLYEAARAADSVLITVSGKGGVAVGTEKAVKAADKRGLTKILRKRSVRRKRTLLPCIRKPEILLWSFSVSGCSSVHC